MSVQVIRGEYEGALGAFREAKGPEIAGGLRISLASEDVGRASDVCMAPASEDVGRSSGSGSRMSANEVISGETPMEVVGLVETAG
jgi:hypothetical protein